MANLSPSHPLLERRRKNVERRRARSISFTGGYSVGAISRPRLARGQLFERGERRENWWRERERERWIDREKKEEETADGGGQGEEKRDPPVAPATSWRGRTRPTIPKKLEAEERTSNARVSRLKRRRLEIAIDRSIDRSWDSPRNRRRADPRSRCQRDRHWISYNEPHATAKRELFFFFFFFLSPSEEKIPFDEFETREQRFFDD